MYLQELRAALGDEVADEVELLRVDLVHADVHAQPCRVAHGGPAPVEAQQAPKHLRQRTDVPNSALRCDHVSNGVDLALLRLRSTRCEGTGACWLGGGNPGLGPADQPHAGQWSGEPRRWPLMWPDVSARKDEQLPADGCITVIFDIFEYLFF